MARKPKHGDELTKNVQITSTPTAIARLDAWAKRLGLSRSALITKIALGELSTQMDAQQLGEFFAS